MTIRSTTRRGVGESQGVDVADFLAADIIRAVYEELEEKARMRTRTPRGPRRGRANVQGRGQQRRSRIKRDQDGVRLSQRAAVRNVTRWVTWAGPADGDLLRLTRSHRARRGLWAARSSVPALCRCMKKLTSGKEHLVHLLERDSWRC